jgi:CO/xanthine dehydrogenase Mo-binding subunit
MRKCVRFALFNPFHHPYPSSREVESPNPNLVRAWGFAAAYKNTGLGGGAPDKSGADVELYEDGTFQVRSSAAEMGQGLVTVMRLVVAEEMSVAPDR